MTEPRRRCPTLDHRQDHPPRQRPAGQRRSRRVHRSCVGGGGPGRRTAVGPSPEPEPVAGAARRASGPPSSSSGAGPGRSTVDGSDPATSAGPSALGAGRLGTGGTPAATAGRSAHVQRRVRRLQPGRRRPASAGERTRLGPGGCRRTASTRFELPARRRASRSPAFIELSAQKDDHEG